MAAFASGKAESRWAWWWRCCNMGCGSSGLLRIRVGGCDVRRLDPLELRRQFGVVLQDPYLFTGTLEENIRLGTHGIDREAVEEAAQQVNLMDFINSLPDGFGQSIRERGSGLST